MGINGRYHPAHGDNHHCILEKTLLTFGFSVIPTIHQLVGAGLVSVLDWVTTKVYPTTKNHGNAGVPRKQIIFNVVQSSGFEPLLPL